MTGKIFRSIFLSSLSALLICLIIVTGIMYDYSGGIQRKRLKDELVLAAAAVEQQGSKFLSSLELEDYRLTWIAPDGSVLFDTQADVSEMDNHSDREEFIEAMEGEIGESNRYSSTLTEKTMYYAKRLNDGSVLRVSTKSATVLLLLLGMLTPLLTGLAIILVLAAFLSRKMAKKIVQPLNDIDLENPAETGVYEELSPLLRKVNQLRSQLGRKMNELSAKQSEFEQITGYMREGLVLLDNSGVVLTVNNSAKDLFSGMLTVGCNFFDTNIEDDVKEAANMAIETGHGETRTESEGSEYQVDISAITGEDSAVIGTVILAFDITENVFSERNRREFTANVSHELKTPLQSITGSAELIESGLVKAEDMPRFIKHIRSEATRLVSLIDDIIRLSQLDEGDALEDEEVHLGDLAHEILEELHFSAGAKNITLTQSGDSFDVFGVRKLLADIIYNLCDNAIKYNNPGGKVELNLRKSGKNAIITVSDNGIGIPEADKARVFERFYRVDKSRSKESGGTGLGLSIVKHAVMYHRGKIELESTCKKGSVFMVTLPICK